MAAYCGAIGSVNVLDFVSTDLFDESQENPFLLHQNQHQKAAPSLTTAKLRASPAPSPRKHASVRFAELPLDDVNEMPSVSPTKMGSANSPKTKRPSGVVIPPPPMLHQSPPFAASPAAPPATNRPSITITLPLGLGFSSSDGTASSAITLAEETELHKLLYSLTQLGLGQQPQQQQPPPMSPASTAPSSLFADSYASTLSAPTSPTGYPANSLWVSPPSPETRASGTSPQGTASLMFRPLPSRQSRRMTARASRRYSSAPNSPQQRDAPSNGFFSADDTDPSLAYSGSQPSSPTRSRGSVTFLTVKNLLRGGGALARTVRREQPNRRPTCMGTVSSRLKRREKFQRPTVITDAYHRVSDMKLGTSPMKVKIKNRAFPELGHTEESEFDEYREADPGMPSPRGILRKESLITLETLDKIGTRHACPVQLIEEPLPDFSNVQPRVDAWNHYKKPKKGLRRPSAWLLGATATSTPHDDY